MAQTESSANKQHYKFRELKVYASTEWLAGNKKKYRQVFDKHDTAYVYAELSLFNKKFDEGDWELDVELRCYSMRKNRKELCNLPFRKKISRYDSVVYIREGWGNKSEGAFWKKGTYYWEAWVEGEKVATKYFYIEGGRDEAEDVVSSYLEVQNLRLYEGPYDDVLYGERRYLKAFSSEETRYVYVEIDLKNLNIDQSWQCELFAKFYNDARELKGQVVRLQRIEEGDDVIRVSAGWGSNVKGSWRKDRYTAELIFMDNLLATIPFTLGDEFEEGLAGVLLPRQQQAVILTPTEDYGSTFEDVLARLDSLIGLAHIKKQVRDHAQYIQFLKLRKERGFKEKESINIHAAFVGNPGTGKTTVAKMMGSLYHRMGLLSKGHVMEVDRVDLVGEYIGQTAPKVKEVLEKAKGGVLFIDEAYSLARSKDDTKDFGREVIEMLVKEMSNGEGDMAVIVAGYPKEMDYFLSSNPGLKSRFKQVYEFSDYLPQELTAIAQYACAEKEVQLSPAAQLAIEAQIVRAYRDRDRTFGNARYVYDLLEKAKINLGLRVMQEPTPESLPNESLKVIELADVENLAKSMPKTLPSIPVDEALLEAALGELNHLIGMQSIKIQINDLVQLVRYYQGEGRDILHRFFFHTLFIGNPGTGKTTVARILTRIYKALGILERGHMVETDRQGLVAGYVGQTAIKTAEKVDEAIGGVLFIDEAYALSSRGGDARGDFGDEAIQTLLKRMEDFRGQFFIFAAGYPDNMEQFLKTNPGLKSRFDKTLRFEDYTPAELMQIATLMIEEAKLDIAADAAEHLEAYLNFIYTYRDKYFGNARTVRKIIKEVIRTYDVRMAGMTAAARAKAPERTLQLADVEHLKLDKDSLSMSRGRIGFRT